MGLWYSILLIASGLLTQEPEVKVIKPSEAAEHVGKKVQVEMIVESSSLLKDRDLCFLNS